MTREEAFKIAKKIGNSVPWHEDTVRLLEALGLIKFEPKEAGLPIGFHFPWSERDNWTKMCTALQQQGFKIIKNV